MDANKRQRLEAAGFRVGDAGDFLDLTDEERGMVELRLAVARAVRRRREARQMTQEQLAKAMKSSQSRVAKLEAAAAGVSLDQMFRGLFALGFKLEDLGTVVGRPHKRKPARQA
jgi:ribosome-binding protein aMBF1 (putative translation factor)